MNSSVSIVADCEVAYVIPHSSSLPTRIPWAANRFGL
jgi:hypothetical protein